MNLDTTAALHFIRDDSWPRSSAVALIALANAVGWWGIFELVRVLV